jgi:hypothetical protein
MDRSYSKHYDIQLLLFRIEFYRIEEYDKHRSFLSHIDHGKLANMYEHSKEPLLSPRKFFIRLLNHGLIAFSMIAGSLGIGVLGYHYFENLSWIDSLVNASMLLGGMGPVNPLQTTAGKLFASFYALYSGMVFLIIAGVLLAPVFHRFLHHFHLDMQSEGDASNDSADN